jgi:hypothetical protein
LSDEPDGRAEAIVHDIRVRELFGEGLAARERGGQRVDESLFLQQDWLVGLACAGEEERAVALGGEIGKPDLEGCEGEESHGLER